MQVKSVQIGRLTAKNNVFLAPLAGFSDYALRQVCYELGAGLCVTEMISAKGLKYNNAQTVELAKKCEWEKSNLSCAQIFGNDPSIMRQACESPELSGFDIIDINMGCPVPKVFNNGEGSALMQNPSLAGKIVAECVKSGKTITVKTRLGINEGEKTAVDFCKVLQDNGASMITVHGRSKQAVYAGAVDFETIYKIKKNSFVPIIANGGIFCADDAKVAFERSGADGVMLARGALFNPYLFAEITTGKKQNGLKRDLALKQIELLLQTKPKQKVATYMRKQLAHYLHGVAGGKQLKTQIFAETDFDKLIELLRGTEF